MLHYISLYLTHRNFSYQKPWRIWMSSMALLFYA